MAEFFFIPHSQILSCFLLLNRNILSYKNLSVVSSCGNILPRRGATADEELVSQDKCCSARACSAEEHENAASATDTHTHTYLVRPSATNDFKAFQTQYEYWRVRSKQYKKNLLWFHVGIANGWRFQWCIQHWHHGYLYVMRRSFDVLLSSSHIYFIVCKVALDCRDLCILLVVVAAGPTINGNSEIVRRTEKKRTTTTKQWATVCNGSE